MVWGTKDDYMLSRRMKTILLKPFHSLSVQNCLGVQTTNIFLAQEIQRYLSNGPCAQEIYSVGDMEMGIDNSLFWYNFVSKTFFPLQLNLHICTKSGCKDNPCSFVSVLFNSVTQSCLTLCHPVDCSMPGLPVHHQFWGLLKLMSIESLMPSNHPILRHPLLFLPSIFPSSRVCSNESVLPIM